MPLIGLIVLALVLYAGACAYLRQVQERFIFFPEREVTETPATYGLDYEDVYLPLEKDQLHGWWIPADRPDAPVVLYLHGNGINVGANAEHAHRLQHRLGFTVFLFDYRGYGKSSGPFPAEDRVYADAERAWQYLVRERRIDPGRILLYGHSLGGAVAVEMAVRHPEVAGVVVESSFTSILEMTAAQRWTRFFPVAWLLHQRFDSIAKMSRLQVPVLFIHGRRDRVISHTMSERNYAAASQPKRLLLVAGGDHATNAVEGGSLYLEEFRAFAHAALLR
ncbi:MAG: lysophospholipase [Aphanocapsa lilacina HA4352-LM1]|nr:lysophospholipase [Aphanocapsa lilacina HA4352-LM1]